MTGTPGRPRVLLVDDHQLFVDGLTVALARFVEVVGAVSTAWEVIRAVEVVAPDVVLLDLSLREQSGLKLISRIRAVRPEVKVIMVTMHADRQIAEAAFAAGADGFVPKDAGVAELERAIAAVMAGRRHLAPLDDQPARPAVPAVLSALTPRQQQVLRLIGEGLSSAAVAEALKVSPHTITFHRMRIREALGLRSEWDLTRYAIVARGKIGEPPSTAEEC